MYAGLLISKSASNRYHFHLHHLHPNPLHLIVVSLVLILLKVHEILLNEEYLVRKLPGFCYMHVFTCPDPEIIFGGKGSQTFIPEFYCVNFKKLKFFPHPHKTVICISLWIKTYKYLYILIKIYSHCRFEDQN